MSAPNAGVDKAKSDETGWSASTYNTVASFVYSDAFTSPILQLLNAQPGEKILDLGCGSGELTRDLSKVVGEKGVVVGVDASSSMVEKARENGVLSAFIADAQDLSKSVPPKPKQDRDDDGSSSGLNIPAGGIPEGFDYKFDAVFTNAALHWCKRDPPGVIRGVAGVLKKGGRFVGEFGGYMNVIGVRCVIHEVLRRRGHDPKAVDPWYFPSTQTYSALLTAHGFKVKHISLTPRLTPVSSIVDWQRSFVKHQIFLKVLNEDETEEAMKEVEELVREDCWGGDEQGWGIMYTRLRFEAVLE